MSGWGKTAPMGHRIHFEPMETYLAITLTGEYDADQVTEDFGRMLQACVSTGMSKVLIDYRELKNVPADAMSRFHYLTNVYKQYLDFRMEGGALLRLAYVAPGNAPSQADPLVEAVAENYGFPTMETTDMEEAVRWLHEEGESPDRK